MNRAFELDFLRRIAAALHPDADLAALPTTLRDLAAAAARAPAAPASQQFVRWLRTVQTAAAEAPPPPQLGDLVTLVGPEQRPVSHRPRGAALVFGPLKPGLYQLQHVTGRTLWSAFLRPAWLDWPTAFPDAPLPAAADAGRAPPERPSIVFPLADGTLELRILPGLGHGVAVLRQREDADGRA